MKTAASGVLCARSAARRTRSRWNDSSSDRSGFMPDSPKRRDFLGLTAIWGSVIALGTALAGVMRLPKPAVQPGPLRVFKLGDPGQFAVGSATRIEAGGFFLFREEQGFHAISSVCTHLGCVVAHNEG